MRFFDTAADKRARRSYERLRAVAAAKPSDEQQDSIVVHRRCRSAFVLCNGIPTNLVASASVNMTPSLYSSRLDTTCKSTVVARSPLQKLLRGFVARCRGRCCVTTSPHTHTRRRRSVGWSVVCRCLVATTLVWGPWNNFLRFLMALNNRRRRRLTTTMAATLNGDARRPSIANFSSPSRSCSAPHPALRRRDDDCSLVVVVVADCRRRCSAPRFVDVVVSC